MNKPNLTDEEIRIDWLVEYVGFKPSEARQYVKDHPKPVMAGESLAIIRERLGKIVRLIMEDLERYSVGVRRRARGE